MFKNVRYLISSFRCVQNVVCFLLGDSLASDLYMPTFQNTLSVPDGTDRVFQNVGIYKSDAGESPKRKQTTFWIRRKLEIKYLTFLNIDYLDKGQHAYFKCLVYSHTSFTSSYCTKQFLCSYMVQLRTVAIIREPIYYKDTSSRLSVGKW